MCPSATIARQTSLPLDDFADAVRQLSKQDGAARGAVYKARILGRAASPLAAAADKGLRVLPVGLRVADRF